MSTLNSLGYEYSAAGGVLRVYNDCGVMIMKKLSNGLYVVQGDIVICDADVSSLSNLDVVDDLLKEFCVYYCEGNLCNINDVVRH